MNKSKISILTDPLPFKRNYIIQHSKNFLRFLRGNFFKNKLIGQKTIYRGHPAVTRSLVNGFKKCKIEHNYNPKNINILLLAKSFSMARNNSTNLKDVFSSIDYNKLPRELRSSHRYLKKNISTNSSFGLKMGIVLPLTGQNSVQAKAN